MTPSASPPSPSTPLFRSAANTRPGPGGTGPGADWGCVACADGHVHAPSTQEPRRHHACRTPQLRLPDRKSTRLNSSHLVISYAVFCLKKKRDMPDTLFLD